MRIADVLECQRASALESHAAVLAHHLFQAGAAADPRRTARYLARAGQRALQAGAFEDAAEAAERALGLDLGEETALLADLYEIRGRAQLGLGQLDDAHTSLQRALSLVVARQDDAAIARVTAAAVFPFVWRWRLAEASDFVDRGLRALSSHAHRERASLQGQYAVFQAGLSRLDEASVALRQAKDTAVRSGDAEVLGRVLTDESYCCFWRRDVVAAVDAGQRALQLLPSGAVWDRADAMCTLSQAAMSTGSWAIGDTLLPEFDAAARRAGYRGATFVCEYVEHLLRWMRTGHTQAFLSEADRWVRDVPIFPFLSETYLGVAELYLGRTATALDRLAHVCAAQSSVTDVLTGAWEANLFAGCALAGQLPRARTLVTAVERLLPVAGRDNPLGRWTGLAAAAVGLAVIGDSAACGTLYPALCALIEKRWVCGHLAVGPNNPQLAAAISAQAAGLADRAREHFATAQRQADELPHRLLQPTVRY